MGHEVSAGDQVRATDSFGVEKTAAPRIPAPNVVDPFEPLARAAYEAYSASVGGRSAVTGAELPSWDGLLEQETGPAVRAGWRAAAKA